MTTGGVSAPLFSSIGFFPFERLADGSSDQHISILVTVLQPECRAGLRRRPSIYCGAMAESPDLASLAKRYLDLWQEQLTAMAADPDLAESLARLFAGLMPPGWAPPLGGGDDSFPAGTAAAPHSSRQRSDAVDEFARRLSALEARLAAVEAGARAGGKRAQAKPRRGRR
jgi:hypothetical protein